MKNVLSSDHTKDVLACSSSMNKKDQSFLPHIRAIIGLGNPGHRYIRSVHNVGFLWCDYVAAWAQYDAWMQQKSTHSIIAHHFSLPLLCKPQTYMNLSGRTLVSLMKKYALKVHNILVVVDDVNIPLGTYRLRMQGSHGGHNGLRHIQDIVGKDYARLRFGVAPEKVPEDLSQYVLSSLPPHTYTVLHNTFARGMREVSLLNSLFSSVMA